MNSPYSFSKILILSTPWIKKVFQIERNQEIQGLSCPKGLINRNNLRIYYLSKRENL